MPPKKKPNTSSSSASKKSSQNANSQPTKYGIQHFFGRLSQKPNNKNQSNSSPQNPKPCSNSNVPESTKSKLGEIGSKSGSVGDTYKGIENGVVQPIKEVGLAGFDEKPKNGSDSKRGRNEVSEKVRVSKDVGYAASAQNPRNRSGLVRRNGVAEQVRVSKDVGLADVAEQNPKNGSNLNHDNTPPENLLVDLTNSDDVTEVSPEISKCLPSKRFKFSPGMIINQSQDDGGEEVTWKITPVNERLQAISKLAPDVVKALADASRLNSSSFQQMPDNAYSHSSKRKVHEEHPMPTTEVPEKSSTLRDGLVLERGRHGQHADVDNQNGNVPELSNSGALSTQSPFKTPPSLSYQHDKPTESAGCKGVPRECMGLRQHKKALIDLLDQVESAISVEESANDGQCRHSSGVCNEDKERPTKDNYARKVETKTQDDSDVQLFDPYFLVLEVTEKRATTSAGAQCSLKDLRVLNERSGEEQCVHLWDDWFYSVIEPGDTIRVIGEFDNQGNCDAGLLMENPTIELLQEFSKIVIQKNIEGLYACGVQEKDVRVTLKDAIPRICDWIENFTNSQKANAPNVDFGPNDGSKRVSVCDVVDIEEMAWAPRYGLKGMIDASLRVQILSNSKETSEKIMPLEFKTGKATSGQAKHSAQLILYTLLLSERYMQKIDSGLLYYLSTNKTLVHGGSAESSGLGDLFESLTDHLTNSHKVFFKQWDRLIDLEAKELQLPMYERGRSNVLKNESFSSCLASIVLDASAELHLRTYAKDERFLYRFVHKDNGSFTNQSVEIQNSRNGSFTSDNELHSSLRIGDRVISCSKRLRLPRSTESSMSQDLYQQVWRIEKDEVATSYATMRFDSGSILSQDPAISYIWSEKNLNADQRRAIIKILTAKDYTLVLGMPGTGKTSTMVYAVKALLMRGASILLTSYTNSAVDNLLVKLKAQGIDFLRIGRSEAVHKEVQGHCLSDMDIHSVEEIRSKLGQVKVVAVTCLGITSPLLVNKKFDVCIIDEAGQTSLPAVRRTSPSNISTSKSGQLELVKFALVPDILPAFETKEKKTVNNPIEAYIVAAITEALANHGVEKVEIGIITPYNSQATLIQHVLNMEAVEVHTIDKYQGRDKDCIILSFVRSSRNPKHCSSSLLDDWHRINVALTRAKKKLIMVGSCKTLSRVPLLKLLIEKVEEQSGIFCITRKDFEPKTELELKRCSSHIR
ncbi:DNA replication ATP-dependent helicase/nuclease DNA2 [Bienertia sinuspersici]